MILGWFWVMAPQKPTFLLSLPSEPPGKDRPLMVAPVL